MFKILSLLKSQDNEEREVQYYRKLIRKEAKLGGELFGFVSEGGRREFFCLNEYTWVWHEEWVDRKGVRRAITTRYEVRPDGVLKAQDGQPYRYVTPQEGRRLHKAVKLYNDRVHAELYA